MHAKCGHAVDDNGILVVTDWQGDERRMGSLPDRDVPLALVTFEEALEAAGEALLTDAQIEEICRSGVMDGRAKFGSTMVDNQNTHGSCNGFLEAGVLGCARVRRGEPFEFLSGAYAYSLMNGGRDQGSQLAAGLAGVAGGVCRRELCNWRQIYPHLYDRAACAADAKRFRGFLQYPCATLRGLWSGLAMGFDGGVAVHAAGRFMSTDSTGMAGVANGGGNHAVRCDGIVWGPNGPTGTGVNSWGTGYGDGGRMLMDERHFAQTFRNHQFWILPTTTDDPDDANKPPRIVVQARGPRIVPVAA